MSQTIMQNKIPKINNNIYTMTLLEHHPDFAAGLVS